MKYVAAIPVCFLLSTGLAVPQSPGADLHDAIDRAQQAREERLLSYTVTEHYSLKNTRFGTSAELVANVSYSREFGKIYNVVSRSGSPILQTKVLNRILAEESAMSHGDVRRTALITSANYTMRVEGEQVLHGRRCLMIILTPRRHSPHLLKGRLWVDPATQNVVRLEGVPPVSPSFWSGAPMIYRDYADIGDFAYARRGEVVTNSRLSGKTELTIEYTGYQIHLADSQ